MFCFEAWCNFLFCVGNKEWNAFPIRVVIGNAGSRQYALIILWSVQVFKMNK